MELRQDDLPGKFFAVKKTLSLSGFKVFLSGCLGKSWLGKMRALGCLLGGTLLGGTVHAQIDAPDDFTRTSYTASPRAIAFSWDDNSDNETHFDLQLSADGGTNWTALGQVGTGTTTFSGTLPAGNELLFFRVLATDGTNFSAPSNIISVEGTDPSVADTDADGMTDAFEVLHGLDPYYDDAYEDADGDRYPNIYEFARGSDPSDAESVPVADYIAEAGATPVGNVYATIQAALDQVSADHRIVQIRDGVYSGSGNVNLTVSGSHPVLILSERGAAYVAIDGSGTTGLINTAGNVVLDGLSLWNGSATEGGAIHSAGGSLLVINCVFSGNHAVQNGGGIHQEAGRTTVIHSTFLDNTAGTAGSAIYAEAGEASVMKSILWNSGTTVEIGSSGTAVPITVEDSVVRGGFPGSGNINSDPLVRLDGHLTSDSPAIDQGGILASTLLDMDGEVRPEGSTTDIGADEWVDTDDDDLPDWWELDRFGSLDAVGSADADLDGLTNRQEYESGSDPKNYYSQGGTTLSPDLTIVSGDSQVGNPSAFSASPLVVQVTSGTNLLSNAPVTFLVTGSGGGQVALNTSGTGLSTSLDVITGSNGQAQVYYKFPSDYAAAGEVEASAGGSEVVFSASTHEIPQSGLKMWLKADAGVTKDGSNYVSSWADQSGYANDGTQGTSASQPLWVSNVVNGKPVLRFDGSNDFLTTGTNSSLVSSDFTYFVVSAFNSTSGSPALLSRDEGGGATNKWIYWYNSGGMQLHIQPGNQLLSSTAFSRTNGQVNLLALKKSGTTYQHYRNASANGSAVATLAIPSINSDFRIGQAENNFYLNGDIAEVIAYDHALSDSDRNKVEGYLNTKYGFGFGSAAPQIVPSGGVYASSPAVTLSAEEGAVIYYTTDGSTPTTGSTIYSGSFTVSGTTTVKATAAKPGFPLSTVVSSTFTIDSTTGAGVPQTGLALWLRADAGVVLSGSNSVESWQDQSGGGRHLTQANASYRPTAQSSVVNGKPTIRFDGINDKLAVSTSSGWGTSEFTVSVLLKPSSTKDWNQQLGATGAWGQFFFHAYATGAMAVGTSAGTAMLPGTIPNGTLQTGAWQLFTFRFNNGTAELYKNQTLIATTAMANPSAWTGFMLGAESANSIDGDVAEVLVYSEALSAQELGDLQEYLVVKYNLGFTLANPQISPPAGTYATDPFVSINTSPGRTIHYTTDGSTPTTSSPVYSGSFTVSGTTTVKAISAKTGYANSAVTSVTYIVDSRTEGVSRDGLALWLKADTGIVVSGSNSVAVWEDQSGGGRHLVQSSTTYRPTIQPNVVNGNPVVRFDGVNDKLAVTTSSGWGTSDFTVSVLLKPQSTTDWNQQLGATGTWGQFFFHAYATGAMAVGTSSATALLPGEIPNGTMQTGAWQLFTFRFGAGTGQLYKGKTLVASKSMANPAAWSGFMLGAENANSINGDIAEVLVYSKALSDAELLDQQEYLDEIYDLAYAPTPPQITPPGGTYATNQTIVISASVGRTIHYTTDGSTPTSSSPVYSGSFTVSGTTTVQAMTVKAGYPDSDVTSMTYSIDGGTADVPKSNLALWLKADAGVVLSGSNKIATWEDQSGLGKHLAQANSSNQPITVLNALNGHPSVRFDGVNDKLSVSTSSGWNSSKFTVAVLLKPFSTTDWNQQLGATGGWGQFFFHAYNAGQIAVGTTSGSALIAGGTRPRTMENGSLQLFVFRFNSGTAQFYRGRELIASKSMASPAAWTGFMLGSEDANTINGDVAEVFVYSDALSDGALGNLQEYLEEKYDPDSDGDGMPSSYEIANGLDPDVSDRLVDIDGDRVPGTWEYLKGANPNDVGDVPLPDFIVDIATGDDSPSDNIYTTIGAAVSAAPVLGTGGVGYSIIQVNPGQYAEKVTLPADKAIALIGPTGIERAELLGGVTGQHVLEILGRHFVDGFLISRPSGAGATGVGIWGQSPVGSMISNCIVTAQRNRAVQVYSGELTLDHCTVFGGGTDVNGKGISLNSGYLKLSNSIVWNGGNYYIPEIGLLGDAQMSLTNSIVTGGQYGSLSMDPLLLKSGKISAVSPAIDAGSDDSGAPTDIDGEARPAGVRRDIGADEFVDTDNDGMADAWEMEWFGNLSQDATSDPDGDRLSNYIESLFSLNPTEADSDDNGQSDFYDVIGHEGNIPMPPAWSADTDGDGLSDNWEFYWGTDAELVDTNGDGISDFVAVSGGLDATGLDVDGDGINNDVELAQGTNPFSQDSDRDGVNDDEDWYPTDPALWEAPEGNPSDTTGPVLTLTQPDGVIVTP